MKILRECCTDHNGETKKKYTLKEDAQDAARNLELDKRIIAEVYECDDRDGWHLTTVNVRQESRVLKQGQRISNRKKVSKTTIGKALGKEFFESLKGALTENENKKI